MSTILTPELIQAMAENAGELRSVISSGDERAVLGGEYSNGAAGPRLIKFKFVLCDVEINNYNAAAAQENNGAAGLRQ